MSANELIVISQSITDDHIMTDSRVNFIHDGNEIDSPGVAMTTNTITSREENIENVMMYVHTELCWKYKKTFGMYRLIDSSFDYSTIEECARGIRRSY